MNYTKLDMHEYTENPQEEDLPAGLLMDGWLNSICDRTGEKLDHVIQVTAMTVKLARRLGIPEREIQILRNGAFLHDVGNLGIPEQILQKPESLTKEEWSIIQKHPKYAYDLIYPVECLRPYLSIPFSHHEQWDGSGYPRGLCGEDIPLAARIFAVVDTWDSLVRDHPFRKAWRQREAIKYIKAMEGSQFDPQVTEAFIDMISGGPGRDLEEPVPA